MALAIVNDSATVSTTEYFLASDSTTATYQTADCMLQAFIHVASIAGSDQFTIKVYEKVNGTGPHVIWSVVLDGAQASPIVTPALLVGDGWEISVIRSGGSNDRTVHWSLRTIT